MRPTVQEQLRGLRRVLSEVVAPAVGDRYASDILAAALGNLEVLEGAFGEVEPFLRWDHDETGRVLEQVAAHLPAETAAAAGPLLSAVPPPHGDLGALASACTERRRLLAEAVSHLEAGGEAAAAARAAVRDHLRRRIDRYPFTAAAGRRPGT